MAPLHVALLSAILLGCAAVPAPRSAPPSAESAIAALRFDRACGRATRAGATLSLVTPTASFRGDANLLAAHPRQLRLEVQSSFGVALLQLAADETMVAVDPRNRVFSMAPNDACSLHAWLGLPIPTDLLVAVLRGSVPVIAHDRSALAWDHEGAWVLSFEGSGLVETVRVAVAEGRHDAEWADQALEVREAEVRLGSRVLWRIESDQHAAAPLASPVVDPDGLDDPIPPSGPSCAATLPRRVILTLPERSASLRLELHDVAWNPPLPPGAFALLPPDGFRREWLRCGAPAER